MHEPAGCLAAAGGVLPAAFEVRAGARGLPPLEAGVAAVCVWP